MSKSRGPSARHWCVTSFSPKWAFAGRADVSYSIYGREICPKTKKRHLQGYVCMEKKVRIPALKKIDPTAHFEVKRGSVKEAIDYCKKDEDFVEEGSMPVEKGQNAMHAVMALAREGKIKEIKDDYPGMYLRYGATIERLDETIPEPLDEPCGVWIHGPAGSGKDGNVELKYKPYEKSHSKWWDGYKDQEVVLFKDLDHNTAKWCPTFIKHWADRYPFRAEFKGGSRMIRPKQFFVTSQYAIGQVFPELEVHEALKRRFDVVTKTDEGIHKVKRPKIALATDYYDHILKIIYIINQDGLSKETRCS